VILGNRAVMVILT